MVKEGSSYNIRTGFFEHLEEKIRVDRLSQKRLGDMTETDARREGVKTLRGFIEERRTLTGAWDPDVVVWGAEFHVELSYS